MGKIEYGSVYKFLVSLGVILVFFPFVALYLLATSDVKALSQSEMSSISAYSFTMLEWKQSYMYICRDILPYLGAVSLLGGMVILVWGFVKWLRIQSLEDSNLEIENRIKGLSASEKLAQVANKYGDLASTEEPEQGGGQGNVGQNGYVRPEDAQEHAETPAEPAPGTDQVDAGQNGDSQPENAREHTETPEEMGRSGNRGNAEFKMMNPSLSCIQKDLRKIGNFERLYRYLKIEDQSFEYIKRRSVISFDKYSLRRNVKIGGCEYDAIAISKEDNIDLLFEVKYWPSIPDLRVIKYSIQHLIKAAEFYESYMKRNFRIKLIVVTQKELVANVNKLYFSTIIGMLPGMIDLTIIDESELF